MARRTLNDRILKALKPAKHGERYDVMDGDAGLRHPHHRQGHQDLHAR